MSRGPSMVRRMGALLRRPDFRERPFRATARRVLWHNGAWLNSPYAVVRHARGFELLTPWTAAGSLIYYQGCTEPQTLAVLESLLEPGTLFVDVGAHIGEYTVLASRLVGSAGHVLAVEANAELCAGIRASAELNTCDNVTVVQAAAGADPGRASFRIENEPSTSSLVGDDVEAGEGVVDVPVVRIDDAVADMELPGDAAVVVKLDVEGGELGALLGMRQLLAGDGMLPTVEAVVLEVVPANCRRAGYEPRAIFDLLNGSGFSVLPLPEFRHDNSALDGDPDDNFVAYPAESRNEAPPS